MTRRAIRGPDKQIGMRHHVTGVASAPTSKLALTPAARPGEGRDSASHEKDARPKERSVGALVALAPAWPDVPGVAAHE
jgi:hypothetical protein